MSNYPSTNGSVIHSSLDSAQHTVLDCHQDIFDALPMRAVIYEAVTPTSFRFLSANQTIRCIEGFTSTLLGQLLTDLFPPDQAGMISANFQACLATYTTHEVEEQHTLGPDTIWVHCMYVPLPARPEQSAQVLLLMHDITERKERELTERAHQEAIITYQAATLAELSTPLLSISDTTVVMPLIGAVDSRRVQQMMEALLAGVAESRAVYVIVDITGVQVVDTQVASAFIRAAQAVQLLGARMILTGIRPEVAQTLVGLGTDLRGITTRGTLQAGITYAREREQRA